MKRVDVLYITNIPNTAVLLLNGISLKVEITFLFHVDNFFIVMNHCLVVFFFLAYGIYSQGLEIQMMFESTF